MRARSRIRCKVVENDFVSNKYLAENSGRTVCRGRISITRARDQDDGARGSRRGLLGLLPSTRADPDDDVAEPQASCVSHTHARMQLEASSMVMLSPKR
jgi:hypothetical protein